MKVDGVPNVRTCVEPLREGLRVERQEGHAHPKLDVEIESRLGERRNLIETDILVAVSYTHLDVYKRQTMYWATGSSSPSKNSLEFPVPL